MNHLEKILNEMKFIRSADNVSDKLEFLKLWKLMCHVQNKEAGGTDETIQSFRKEINLDREDEEGSCDDLKDYMSPSRNIPGIIPQPSSFTKNSEKSVQVKTLIKLMLAVTGVYKMDPVHFH